jgi:hypothetical protein
MHSISQIVSTATSLYKWARLLHRKIRRIQTEVLEYSKLEYFSNVSNHRCGTNIAKFLIQSRQVPIISPAIVYTGATGEVRAEMEIVPGTGTGTGELLGLRGEVVVRSTGNKDVLGEMEYLFSIEEI